MKFVDLFSGCGGLSLGIERAGGQLIAAVEKSDMAARTFFHNYIEDANDIFKWQRHVAAPLGQQLKKKVLVSELANVLKDADVMKSLADMQLDLVVGGPPCQGFSLAGRRNHEDMRNRLAWEYLDFVQSTRPKAVVIENVVGMSQKFEAQEESSFSQLQRALALQGDGYEVQAVLVNAMHYGAPQHRPRLMLIALRHDVARHNGIAAQPGIWKSSFAGELGAVPALAPLPTVSRDKVFTVRDAVADLSSSVDNYVVDSQNSLYRAQLNAASAVLRPRKASAVEAAPCNHTFRKHTDTVIERFSLYQLLSSRNLDIQLLVKLGRLDAESAFLEAKSALRDVVFPVELQAGAHASDLRIIDSLDELCGVAVRLATRKHSQKVLRWNEPARTVVTLPDDYVHPLEPRIFTVRELARFQGFPDEFEFIGKETTGSLRRKFEVPQYTQVGNAVSPWQSLAVGRLLQPLIAADKVIGHPSS